MTNRPSILQPSPIPPPTKHQLSLMIWLCVFPTLTVINLVLGDWLATLSPVLRTFVLATIAVPVVIYGLMPHLHRIRVRLTVTSRAQKSTDSDLEVGSASRVVTAAENLLGSRDVTTIEGTGR